MFNSFLRVFLFLWRCLSIGGLLIFPGELPKEQEKIPELAAERVLWVWFRDPFTVCAVDLGGEYRIAADNKLLYEPRS